ncbi:hypothetical protein J6590_020568 [Homalodisca vitripennis]|nr:hypothetical protein J6590_020568 [Homalodisca vitripennis]
MASGQLDHIQALIGRSSPGIRVLLDILQYSRRTGDGNRPAGSYPGSDWPLVTWYQSITRSVITPRPRIVVDW